MANNRAPKRNSNRYFDEINSQTTPGTLSKELRKALGLSDDMLPIWIYKMRVLGYPPGWVRQAEIQPNLDIIGDEQAKPSETAVEDGEIQPIIYDESATIEYPGYNANFPKHVKDDWLLLGYPPFMLPKSSSSTKGETSKSSQSKSTASISSTEPNSKASESISSSQNTAEESAAEAVESAVEEVEAPASQEDVETLDDSVNTADNADTPSEQAPENGDDKESSQASEDVSQNVSIASDTPVTPTQAKRKFTVIQGESADSYQFKRKKLPDLSKWAEGVKGELIQFENLPNSTGNFKKIKDILSNFRSNKSANNGEQNA